jgi:hypothetical protein
VLIERIFSVAIAGKSGGWNTNLLSDSSKHWSGNLFHFHERATREPQEGKLDREPEPIRSSSSTIDELSLFLGKRVVAGDISIREVRWDLSQGVTLFRVEVRRDLVISGHGRRLSSFASFVSYCLLARQ